MKQKKKNDIALSFHTQEKIKSNGAGDLLGAVSEPEMVGMLGSTNMLENPFLKTKGVHGSTGLHRQKYVFVTILHGYLMVDIY